MAISAIDLFRPQPLDGVGQLLASAGGGLAAALNNAVQIGRDSASLRATQEREVLAERERITNLEQRRAEQFDKNFQIDRLFNQDVRTDARDFDFKKETDARDFAFKKEADARNYALQEYSTISNILNAEEDNTLAREKFDLAKSEDATDKAFLKSRAADIEKATRKPSFIGKLFGAEDPLPDDNLSLGRELKDIGVKLRDPNLVSRGDELVSQGTKGVLQRREDLRNTPLPPRPSTRKALTDEDKLLEAQSTVDFIEQKKLAEEWDDLTTYQKLQYEKEQAKAATIVDILRKKLGGVASPLAPATPLSTAPVSAAEEYRNRVKNKK